MIGGTPSTKVRKRASWVCIAFSVLFVFLACRIFIIQVFNYEKYSQKVLDQMTQETTVSADRGNIYDRNGIVIATNVTTYRLFIDPAAISRTSADENVNYADLIAKGVSSIASLGIKYEDVIKQSEYTRYRDRTLMRHLTEEQADEVRAFIDASGLDDKALLHLQATSKRYYPYETLASHVLGFTGGDGNGLYGLEMQYDDILSGTDGKYIGAKDSFGNEMDYDYESYIPAIDGYNITTTIDVYIQAELEEQLQTAYVESGGKNRACGIVLDVDTGAVLAMAVYPSYNLNDPWELNYQCLEKLEKSGFAEGSDEYTALKQQLLLETWANKAVGELYMPGSTFKVITAAMAYEEDIVNDDETFLCKGYYEVAGHQIHCHYHAGHGNITFERGLQQSCNPLLMQMGLRLGSEDYYKYFSAFGYFEKTGIDASGEEYTKEGVTFWDNATFTSSDVYLATASFGQNFKISPIAHMSAINAVANGGDLVTPHFIEQITDNEGNVIFSYETEVKRQVISMDTARKVSQILEEGVATDGGSKGAYVAGYRIAAKTGTSEKKDVHIPNNEYIPYVCSAIAYAPAEAPEISVLFMVDEPTEGVLYASVIAAPYVANLMAEVLPYVGVEAEYSDEELEDKALITPALVLLETEDAVRKATEWFGFDVEIVGDGKYVKAQSPAGGTLVEPGSAKVVIYTTDEAVQQRKTVKVPDLTGMTVVAANGTLANARLNLKIVAPVGNSSSKSIIVISQSIAAGETVEMGTVVEITLGYRDQQNN